MGTFLSSKNRQEMRRARREKKDLGETPKRMTHKTYLIRKTPKILTENRLSATKSPEKAMFTVIQNHGELLFETTKSLAHCKRV
jgi:hypothetical protein